MTNELATIENVLIKGDISQLNEQQRIEYYKAICDRCGLSPVMQPFSYLTLQGKTVLYASKACTDQLRTIHKISVVEMTESERDGVFIVTCKVSNAEGRSDIAKGAVKIEGLKGDMLANAVMKAETKAKRRATLSICGLGILDESELETIPAEAMQAKPLFKNASLRNTWCKGLIDSMNAAQTKQEVLSILEINKEKCKELEANGNEHDVLAVESIRQNADIILKRFKAIPAEGSQDDYNAIRNGMVEGEADWHTEDPLPEELKPTGSFKRV